MKNNRFKFLTLFSILLLSLNCAHIHRISTNTNNFHGLGQVLYQHALSEGRETLTVRVMLDQRFVAEERLGIIETFDQFRSLGIVFVIVSPETESYDLSVKFWNNRDMKSKIVGFYREGTPTIFIASKRIYSRSGLQWVFLHETSHWLGMQHICRFPGESADCSEVGYGEAMMNPETDTDKEFAVSFTELDVLELRRVVGEMLADHQHQER